MSSPHDGNRTSVFETTSLRPGGASPGAAEGTHIGEVLKGAYRVDAKLGEGGMGTVYRGTQLSLGRAVAIKTISASSNLSNETMQRFFREAKILSQLNHPNIVSIIDYGTAAIGGTPFIIMELLTGKPLDGYVTLQSRPPLRQVLNLMSQICAGIGAAHRSNVVHRDLKPSNIYITAVEGTSETVVKLLDFGLAKPATAMPESGLAVTQQGVGLGTCGFTAPEQLEGAGEPDIRADVYGLGAILYFLLTGRPPYQGQTMASVLARQMSKAPDPIDFPALGLAGAEAIEAVLLKAMSISPEDRYQSVAEFKGALEAILTSIMSHVRGPGRDSPDTATHAVEPTQVHRPEHTTVIAADSKGSRRLWLMAAGVLFVAGIALGAWMKFGGKQNGAVGGDAGKASLVGTAPGVTATEITLGLSAPFSGSAKELGRGMQTGIETYFDYVNESGGIHGRKLKLLALDDGYDPKQCAVKMKELIDKPVFAFLGNVGTPTAEVAVPIVLEHGRVLFGAFTGAGLLRREPPDRFIFNYRASYAEETAAIVQHLLTVRNIKPEQIAVFAQKDGYGDAGFSGVAKALRKVGFETEKILRVGYERNTMDLDAAVNELVKQKERIKAVVMVPTYRQAATFIKRVRDSGMNPIFTSVSFVGSDALADALKEIAPQYAAGVIVTQVVPFYESGATAVLEYRERLAKFNPSEKPGFVSLEGYIAAKLFAMALEKAPAELTTDALVTAIEGINKVDLGLGAPISFGPSEHQGSHKVWAVTLDANVRFQNLDLD